MKKIILIISSIFICSTCFARDEKYALGVKASLNFNSLNAKGWGNNNSTSPAIGFYAFANAHKFGIQAEVLYTTQNFVVDSSFAGLYNQYLNGAINGLKNGSYKLNQLQIPILINYRINRKFWLQGGPMFTANISEIDKNNYITTSQKIFKTSNLSFVGGIWIKVSNRININGRYIMGISNMNAIKNSTYDWQNNAIQTGIGFRL
jgi:Outer membrane protein beta-barrel domain